VSVESVDRTRSRRVGVLSRNNRANITQMGALKGRRQRTRDGERTLFANVGVDVISVLDAGAAALNLSRGAYIEHLIREMPTDERGLPPWLAERADAEQLPLTTREEPERAAA
jgi:hypothetical protein